METDLLPSLKRSSIGDILLVDIDVPAVGSGTLIMDRAFRMDPANLATPAEDCSSDGSPAEPYSGQERSCDCQWHSSDQVKDVPLRTQHLIQRSFDVARPVSMSLLAEELHPGTRLVSDLLEHKPLLADDHACCLTSDEQGDLDFDFTSLTIVRRRSNSELLVHKLLDYHALLDVANHDHIPIRLVNVWSCRPGLTTSSGRDLFHQRTLMCKERNVDIAWQPHVNLQHILSSTRRSCIGELGWHRKLRRRRGHDSRGHLSNFRLDNIGHFRLHAGRGYFRCRWLWSCLLCLWFRFQRSSRNCSRWHGYLRHLFTSGLAVSSRTHYRRGLLRELQ
mmetsp:Transcript_15919/g.37549  ORF Transcript_15919/g.37549 Transcript_15919/m.37549 type:complete len:334 (+) Transcript_15919:339-1340(+)